MTANFNTPNSQRVRMDNDAQRQAWKAVAAARNANDEVAEKAARRVVQACWAKREPVPSDWQMVVRYSK